MGRATESLGLPLHNLRAREIFLARSNRPGDTERILYLAVAIAPELIRQRHARLGPCGYRLGVGSIGIGNIQLQVEGEAAFRQRRHAEFRSEIIREHQVRITDTHLHMHQFAARPRRPRDLDRIECAFQEIDILRGAFYKKVRRHSMKSGRSVVCCFCHCYSIPAPAVARYAWRMRTVLFALALGGLHAQTTIGIDSHIDTAQRVLIDRADISQRSPVGHVDIPRLREGGVNTPFFALWVPTYYKGAEAIRRTLDLRDAMQRLFDLHPEQIALALTAADVERITRSGRIAAILTVEGGHQIDNDLAVLRMYHRLGIRSMTLTHFRNTDWADSSTDTPAHNGLAPFGKEVVREMNRLGMIVDVSHVADKTFFDVLAASNKPVIASHSSCRALSDVPRNMTDDMIRALAKNGGVMGINFGEGFLNPKDAGQLMASIEKSATEPSLTGKALDDYAAEEFHKEQRAAKPAIATLDDAVAHIDYAVKLAGVDHVGIGSDFDGISSPPKGLEDISKVAALKAAIRKKGYSEEDVKKIFGGNLLRVLREVTGK